MLPKSKSAVIYGGAIGGAVARAFAGRTRQSVEEVAEQIRSSST